MRGHRAGERLGVAGHGAGTGGPLQGVPPARRLPLGRGRGHGQDDGGVGRPGRVPADGAVREEGDPAQRRAHGAERAGPFGGFRGQRVQRAQDDPGTGQPGFERGHPRQLRYVAGPPGERRRVQDERAQAGRAQSRDGQAPGVAAPAAQVDEAGAGPGRGGRPADLGGLGGRVLAGLVVEHAGEPGVGPGVAEEVRGDPVGDHQDAGQRRAFRLGDLHQAARDQGRRGGEPEPAGRRAGEPAQLQGEPDGGPAARQVVVEVAVEPLEPRVQIGCHRDQEQVHVQRRQPEPPGQPGQDGPGRRLPGLMPGHVEPSRLVQHARRRLGGEVLPPVRVVGIGITGPPPGHRPPHPLLDRPQPHPQVLGVGCGGSASRDRRAWPGRRPSEGGSRVGVSAVTAAGGGGAAVAGGGEPLGTGEADGPPRGWAKARPTDGASRGAAAGTTAGGTAGPVPGRGPGLSRWWFPWCGSRVAVSPGAAAGGGGAAVAGGGEALGAGVGRLPVAQPAARVRPPRPRARGVARTTRPSVTGGATAVTAPASGARTRTPSDAFSSPPSADHTSAADGVSAPAPAVSRVTVRPSSASVPVSSRAGRVSVAVRQASTWESSRCSSWGAARPGRDQVRQLVPAGAGCAAPRAARPRRTPPPRRCRAGRRPRGCRTGRRRPSGALRRAAQSRVGASKTTSTPDASRPDSPSSRRSPSSTSWITGGSPRRVAARCR